MSLQRFSCIIGPNGSGKSNVIDSMLFVFGYRAQKIRSKKLSVLIHSSDKHKDVQSCTVEVHFQKIIDKVKSWKKMMAETSLFLWVCVLRWKLLLGCWSFWLLVLYFNWKSWLHKYIFFSLFFSPSHPNSSCGCSELYGLLVEQHWQNWPNLE